MHTVVEMHASRPCLIPIESEREREGERGREREGVIIKYVTLYEIADAEVNEL
jgi:hypothetical protein